MIFLFTSKPLKIDSEWAFMQFILPKPWEINEIFRNRCENIKLIPMTLIQEIWYMWSYNQYLKTIHRKIIMIQIFGCNVNCLITDLKLSSIKLNWKIIKNTTCFFTLMKSKKKIVFNEKYIQAIKLKKVIVSDYF